MDYTWLQINEQRPRDIVFVIGLVEEHILSVFALVGVRLQDAVWGDSVFSAQLLPKFVTD